MDRGAYQVRGLAREAELSCACIQPNSGCRKFATSSAVVCALRACTSTYFHATMAAIDVVAVNNTMGFSPLTSSGQQIYD